MTAAIITSRTVLFDSPWVRVVGKTVDFLRDPFYAVEVPDYVAICPRTPDGRIIIVRQYRPSVEAYSWEFPAGLIDPGETPETCVSRELVEETGHRAARLVSLGAFYADAGRLSNRCHHFFCDAAPIDGWTTQEPEVEVHQVTVAELERMIAEGRFLVVQHVAVWLQAKAAGLLA